jgi:hypothetical protein
LEAQRAVLQIETERVRMYAATLQMNQEEVRTIQASLAGELAQLQQTRSAFTALETSSEHVMLEDNALALSLREKEDEIVKLKQELAHKPRVDIDHVNYSGSQIAKEKNELNFEREHVRSLRVALEIEKAALAEETSRVHKLATTLKRDHEAIKYAREEVQRQLKFANELKSNGKKEHMEVRQALEALDEKRAAFHASQAVLTQMEQQLSQERKLLDQEKREMLLETERRHADIRMFMQQERDAVQQERDRLQQEKDSIKKERQESLQEIIRERQTLLIQKNLNETEKATREIEEKANYSVRQRALEQSKRILEEERASVDREAYACNVSKHEVEASRKDLSFERKRLESEKADVKSSKSAIAEEKNQLLADTKDLERERIRLRSENVLIKAAQSNAEVELAHLQADRRTLLSNLETLTQDLSSCKAALLRERTQHAAELTSRERELKEGQELLRVERETNNQEVARLSAALRLTQNNSSKYYTADH